MSKVMGSRTSIASMLETATANISGCVCSISSLTIGRTETFLPCTLSPNRVDMRSLCTLRAYIACRYSTIDDFRLHTSTTMLPAHPTTKLALLNRVQDVSTNYDTTIRSSSHISRGLLASLHHSALQCVVEACASQRWLMVSASAFGLYKLCQKYITIGKRRHALSIYPVPTDPSMRRPVHKS